MSKKPIKQWTVEKLKRQLDLEGISYKSRDKKATLYSLLCGSLGQQRRPPVDSSSGQPKVILVEADADDDSSGYPSPKKKKRRKPKKFEGFRMLLVDEGPRKFTPKYLSLLKERLQHNGATLTLDFNPETTHIICSVGTTYDQIMKFCTGLMENRATSKPRYHADTGKLIKLKPLIKNVEWVSAVLGHPGIDPRAKTAVGTVSKRAALVYCTSRPPEPSPAAPSAIRRITSEPPRPLSINLAAHRKACARRPPPRCFCGKRCETKSPHLADTRNRGRQFFMCSVCKYFEWVDASYEEIVENEARLRHYGATGYDYRSHFPGYVAVESGPVASAWQPRTEHGSPVREEHFPGSQDGQDQFDDAIPENFGDVPKPVQEPRKLRRHRPRASLITNVEFLPHNRSYLKCFLCKMTLQDPRLMSCECHNHCCLSCFQTSCPKCQVAVIAKEPELMLVKLLGQLKVKCPLHQNSRCEWETSSGLYSNLADHLESSRKKDEKRPEEDGTQSTLEDPVLWFLAD